MEIPRSLPTWLKLSIGAIILLQVLRVSSRSFDTNARPMCNADGRCHESPDIPSPRTQHSGSLDEVKRWHAFHQNLVQSARSAKTDGKPMVVFIGDSITESWLGTSLGKRPKRAEGVPEVFEEWKTASGFEPLVLAASGDQTQHLLFRLQDGELTPALAALDNATFVMLIGTNNLGRGHLPGPTAVGVRAVANWTLANTRGRLLLLAVLPRGDGSKKLHRLCPPRCNSDGSPFESFMPAVDKVNDALRSQALPALQAEYGEGRVRLVDCGGAFRKDTGAGGEGEEVKVGLMPDRLHPSAEGHQLLRKCVQEELDAWGPAARKVR